MVYSQWGKRLFDFVCTIPVFIVLSPLLSYISLIVWAMVGRPVLFRQVRPGIYGKPFIIYKFRTMTDARDKDGNLLPDEKRLTKLGRFLRAMSFDELPQLWNVIKGDMSIVGPRPLLMKYMGRYSEEHDRRHSAKPGITGWAQVNGRTDIPLSKRLNLDVWYVDNYSFWLDIKVIFLTVKEMLNRPSVSQISQDQLIIDDLDITDTQRKRKGLDCEPVV